MQIHDIQVFQKKIYDFYKNNKRDFSWRTNITPYRVFVSEVMLQQTQTSRVMSKFEQWINRFDSFQVVANSSVRDVLAVWQGLGYNRRGLALHQAACLIVEKFNSQVPLTVSELQTLPGIGPNTAGSILAFAFNMPVVFIETNIRTIFLHEFFAEKTNVSDKEILKLVELTLDRLNPREWYYALMDYGVYLKKNLKLTNKASKHYARQSKFIGSRREIRGAIIRILTKMQRVSYHDLINLVTYEVPHNHHNIDIIIQQLVQENLVKQKHDMVEL